MFMKGKKRKPARYKVRNNDAAATKRQAERNLKNKPLMDDHGGISPKVMKVIDNYFTNGFHQRPAMVAAGYSESTAKCHQYLIFGRPDVRAEIARRMKNHVDAAEIDGDWLMRRLKLLIDANVGDILRKLRDNDHDLNCLSDDELFVLGDVQIVTKTYKEMIDGEPQTVTETKVKLKSEGKNATIVTALKKLGLFKEQLEVTGSGNVIAALMAGRKRASARKEG